jgi:hypothetical protein
MEVYDNHRLPSIITIHPIYLLVILLLLFLVLYSTVRCMNALPILFLLSLNKISLYSRTKRVQSASFIFFLKILNWNVPFYFFWFINVENKKKHGKTTLMYLTWTNIKKIWIFLKNTATPCFWLCFEKTGLKRFINFGVFRTAIVFQEIDFKNIWSTRNLE